jgi:hypothetical protein
MQGAMMFDDISRSHSGVDTEQTLDSRIAVPARRVAEIIRILAAHRIPYAVEQRIFLVDYEEFPPQPTVHDGAD